MKLSLQKVRTMAEWMQTVPGDVSPETGPRKHR